MSRLYTYFVTSALGGATQNALRCKLARGSDLDYLVCLKKYCIDVYSLEKVVGGDDASQGVYRSPGPVLTATLKAHTTLLTFTEYRPPGCDQSHLLVVTSNLVILLLSFDEQTSRFNSRPILALQEPNGQELGSEVLLCVDPNFNLILFHGQKKILKCIMLDHDNYFQFDNVITMRTGESIFMDLVFVESVYRPSNVPAADNCSSSTSRYGSSCSLIPPKGVKRGKYTLECRLLLITASSVEPGGDCEFPESWYSGIDLFFEVEFSGDDHKFNAYGCSPSFAEPMALSKHFTKFLPLKLNPASRLYDSVLLMGCQALGFISIREPQNIKILHTDISIGEICSYCPIEENRSYVIGDDSGVLYLLELVTSNTPLKNALKRRAGASSAAADNAVTRMSKVGTYNVVVDIVATKIGVYSPPTALVTLAPDLIYIATSVGNCRTVKLRGVSRSIEDTMADGYGDSGTLRIEAAEMWEQTNLGPILDFTFGSRQEHGAPSILACCGYGSEGRVCSIALGFGIDVFATHSMTGVRNLFVAGSPERSSGTGEVIVCCAFFHFSRFYKISLPNPKSRKTVLGHTAIDLNTQGDWVVTHLSCDFLGFVENERTVLFTSVDDTTLLQVTSSGMIAFGMGINSQSPVKRTVADMCIFMGITYESDTRIVYAIICGQKIFILLSNHHSLMVQMGQGMPIMCWRKISKQMSACAYIHGAELKKLSCGGLLALSTWEDSELYFLSTDTLDIVFQTSISCSFGIAIMALRFSLMGEALYLFVALSDGTLVLHRVHFGQFPNSCPVDTGSGGISLILRNVYKISDDVIGLESLNVSGGPESTRSCKLSCTNIIITGSNPTLVYANKGKIECVRINIPHITTVCGISSARGRSCFGVPIVYLSDTDLLCIGELDTVGQLHVDTLYSGRSFDKICYHPESDLVVFGCLGELVAHSESGSDLVDGAVDLGGTVFRCLNGESGKCLPGMSRLDACAKFMSLKTKEVIHTLHLPARHLVSSLCTVSFDGHRTMVAIGTSRVSELEDMPREGHIFLVDIVSSGIDSWEIVFLRTVTPLSSGVVEMTTCTNALVVALNESVVVMTLRRDDTPSLSHSHSHSNIKSHRLESLHESDDSYGQYSLVERAEYMSCTYVVSIDSSKDIIVVGDLMNSVRILRWKGNELKELTRDFNSLHCTAVASVDKTRCVVSDSSGNLCVFSKATNVTNDRQALKVEEIGLFHHGENINKILMNPKHETPTVKHEVPAKRETPEFLSPCHCSRSFCCSSAASEVKPAQVIPADLVKGLTNPNKFWNYQFRDVLTCVTSTGSLIQLCLFEDDRLFYRLSMVEEAINSVQSDVGNITNRHWRTFKNKWVMSPSKGFIDGDIVESFLELDAEMRQRIFDDLHKSDLNGFFYSPELLMLEIEYLRRLRR